MKIIKKEEEKKHVYGSHDSNVYILTPNLIQTNYIIKYKIYKIQNY